MIYGVGIDIASPSRMKSVMERHPRIRERLFTGAEIAACERKGDPYASFAARFAAKEAFLKAAGTGLGEDARWTDIEVSGLGSGRPVLAVKGTPAKLLKDVGGAAHISLTHDAGVAAAVCVIEVQGPREG